VWLMSNKKAKPIKEAEVLELLVYSIVDSLERINETLDEMLQYMKLHYVPPPMTPVNPIFTPDNMTGVSGTYYHEIHGSVFTSDSVCECGIKKHHNHVSPNPAKQSSNQPPLY
jgi:hypothetical protein